MRSATRKLRLFDLIVLVAATGCGLALVIFVDRTSGLFVFTEMSESDRREWELDYGPPAPGRVWWWATVLATNELSAGVVVLTAAVFWLRLLAPRPRLKRLFSQGGMAANSTALLVHFLLAVFRLPELLHWKPHLELLNKYPAASEWLLQLLDEAIVLTGFSTVLVWGSLWLSRRWRRECSWINCLGIALGAYWIFAAALLLVLE